MLEGCVEPPDCVVTIPPSRFTHSSMHGDASQRPLLLLEGLVSSRHLHCDGDHRHVQTSLLMVDVAWEEGGGGAVQDILDDLVIITQIPKRLLLSFQKYE